MKKQDWKKLVEEPVSREARERMFAAADLFIEENLASAKADWKAIIEEPVGREARSRTFAAADRFIDEHLAPAREASWIERFLGPTVGFSLAGSAAAVALFFLVSAPKGDQQPAPAAEVAQVEPGMIQDLDLLLELETLEHWEPGKQAKGTKATWKKNQS